MVDEQGNQQLDRLEQRVVGLDADVRDLHTEVTGLHTEVTGLHTEVTDLRTEVAGLHTDLTDLRTEMSARFQDVDGRFEHFRDEILRVVREEGATTRRHVDAAYEQMQALVRSSAESISAVAEKHEELAAGHEALRGRVDRIEVRLDAEKRPRGRGHR